MYDLQYEVRGQCEPLTSTARKKQISALEKVPALQHERETSVNDHIDNISNVRVFATPAWLVDLDRLHVDADAIGESVHFEMSQERKASPLKRRIRAAADSVTNFAT